MLDLKGWLARVWTSSMVRNTGWMTFGQRGNFFLQAGYFLLLARLLRATEYGIFAGAFALVNAVTPYSSLGSPMLFMRYVSVDRDLAQPYWRFILAATVAASIVIAAILAVIGGKVLDQGSIGLIVVLVAANCCMSQVVKSASVVFQTFEQLKITAWLRATSDLLHLLAIAGLMICLYRASAFQCSLGIIASSTVGAVVSIILIRNPIRGTCVSAKLLRLRFWEGIGLSVAGSTQAIYNDVDKIMLGHYGMNAANGIYTMAYKVVDFATTPVSAIDAALLPRFFALNRRGLAPVRRMTSRIIPIATMADLAAVGFTLLASPILLRMAGHGFANAMLAIRWLCWLPALRGIHQLAACALTATGRQNYRTVAQLVVAALNFALNFMWIPTHGWLGAARASLISDGALGLLNLSLVFLIFSCANHSFGTNPYKEQAK